MQIQNKRAYHFFFFVLFLSLLTVSAFSQNMFRKINDFDGDGKADFAITRNDNGYRYWYILQSRDGFRVSQWGLTNDENVSGDYDGDGKTDIAIFRKEPVSPNMMQHTFWIYGSQSGIRVDSETVNVYPNVVGHQQDYDGDGKTDIAWTTGDDSSFFVRYSTGIPSTFAYLRGTPIKIGDVTGDGRAELSTYDSIARRISIRISPNATNSRIFGDPGDIFVPADFDGDGTGDLAIWRPSTRAWWWLRSADNVVKTETFGSTGDIPVPADYDGDGKTDLAIWRGGSQSYYWVYGSQVGVFVIPWGIASDSVVRY